MRSVALALVLDAPARAEPISPELVLVDPELAVWLRRKEARREAAKSTARLRIVGPEVRQPASIARGSLTADRRSELEARWALEVPDMLPRAALGSAHSPSELQEGGRVPRYRDAVLFGGGALAAIVALLGVGQSGNDGSLAAVEAARERVALVSSPPSVRPRIGTAATAKFAPRPVPPPATADRAATAKVSPPPATTATRPARKAEPPARQAPPVTPAATPSPPAATPSAPAATPSAPAATPSPPAATPSPPAATPRTPAPAPRRFAWAPVANAQGYRFELFRGAEQVLVRRSDTPSLELPASWQRDGRRVTLEPGEYRWYVWAVLEDGVAAEAIVQARLAVR